MSRQKKRPEPTAEPQVRRKYPPPSQPPIAPVTGTEDWSAWGEIIRLGKAD